MAAFILIMCLCVVGSSAKWDIPGLPDPLADSVRIKVWNRDGTYQNGRNWQGGTPPCRGDRAVFPRDLGTVAAYLGPVYSNTSVDTPSIEVSELVLPLNGEVVLPTNGELDIVGDEGKTPSCPGKDVSWRANPLPFWLDPNNWRTVGVAETDVDAVPHLERIPCGQDIAWFPDMAFRLMLPDFFVRVGALKFENRESLVFRPRWFFERYFVTANMLVPWVFRGEGPPLVLAASAHELEGEKCGLGLDEYDAHSAQDLADEVCRHVSCPLPSCASPVRPHMHCCDVCGAVLELRPKPAGRLSVSALRNKVQEATRDFAAGDSLAVHVGAVPPEPGLVQVVVVERGSRSGASADSLADFLESEIRDDFPDSRIVKRVSGAMLAPATPGSVTATILGPLIFVLLGFAAMFYVIVRPARLSLSASEIPASFLFARFDNTAGPGQEAATRLEVDVNLKGSASEGSTGSTGPRSGWVARSFRNPLFGMPAQLGTPSFTELKGREENDTDHTLDESAQEPLSDVSAKRVERQDPLVDIAL